ncbi:MAG TPA: ADP-ribosylglycohydrolase family protein [Deltaproteobacteria bacterium]|nr:ADP-ribosylglycohydrolase family protein [Deltaproteobacteria bacterium]HPR55388.1 ADP-ribosylglycohydrolase family protein [Deltaproteobacteria bacterium]HXK48250.1 ADP-ribosylglycohydrolase family protein [Deltaproteobacteria bacterium]
MKDKAKAMVLASFAGDSLALGAHWIYSTERIAREYGRIEGYLAPSTNSYHPTKGKGDFTHYGDQAFVLLESVARTGDFDPGDFSRRWQQLFTGYKGYYDQATKATLENLSLGVPFIEAGSTSDELSGAVRTAPLVYAMRGDVQGLVRSVRAQTLLTHRDALTVDAAEFFALLAHRVLAGANPAAAAREVAGGRFAGTAVARAVDKGLASCSQESIQAVKSFGQDCHTPDAFPAVIHLICSHEGSLREALIQNVMAGGDSAARGMALGMILGAHLGLDAIPEAWVTGLRQGAAIARLLEKID